MSEKEEETEERRKRRAIPWKEPLAVFLGVGLLLAVHKTGKVLRPLPTEHVGCRCIRAAPNLPTRGASTRR